MPMDFMSARHGHLITCLAILGSIGIARADVSLSSKGEVAFLKSERLMPGDAEKVANFLAERRDNPIRIIYLDSRGGRTRVAIEIGRMIRQQGIDTAFHVDRGRCVSACTTIFIGGVHRYYIGGADVQDGVATHRGLGFHPSMHQSGPGNAGEKLILDYYRDMGVSGAADLRYRLYDQGSPVGAKGSYRLFFASGKSAMKAGVATSLSEPENEALKD